MGIPYILPTERSVMDLTVTYAKDSWELPRALAVIASTQVRNLTLDFSKDNVLSYFRTLPWAAAARGEAPHHCC